MKKIWEAKECRDIWDRCKEHPGCWPGSEDEVSFRGEERLDENDGNLEWRQGHY